MPAADCVYHRSCSTNFRNKRIPVKYRENTEKDKGGRPENQVQYEAFREVCDILELGDEEKLSIPELVAVMEEKLSDPEFPAYDRRYMKKKLLDHYGDGATVIGELGKNDIFAYRPQVSSILRQYYDKPKDVDIKLQQNTFDRSCRFPYTERDKRGRPFLQVKLSISRQSFSE